MSSWLASDPDRIKFGFHVSIAGSLAEAPRRARHLDCDCFQMFTSPPQTWRITDHSDEEIALFRERCTEYGFEKYFCHTIYLINLASPEPDVLARSLASLQYCYDVAIALGATGVVTHIGSAKGTGRPAAIQRVADALNRLKWCDQASTMVLLENSAGTGDYLGAGFGEIGEIINACNYRKQLGCCFDTAHAYGAGYDVADRSSLDAMLQEIDSSFGIDRLKVIHANDSKYALGSRRDRHENIGAGYIGDHGMTNIINHPTLKNIPFILETPGFRTGRDKQDIVKIRSLVG